MLRIYLLLVFMLINNTTDCQSLKWENHSGGQLANHTSPNSMFPHPQRAAGHTYRDSLYRFEEHYNDSSIALFIPSGYRQTNSVDLVFYFHGWGNNIDKSIEKFRLLEQFTASGKNAIFVFPEGPKNAPDSFGGKLEEADIFKGLVTEILNLLFLEGKITSKVPGKIVLAGHSGAYRVISTILDRGGLSATVREVYLFDALYGNLEMYTVWLKQYDGRLVNIITPDGGTYDNSLVFLEDLAGLGLPFQKYIKNEISVVELTKARTISVFTTLGHSQVINPFFELLLSSSQLGDIDRQTRE